MYDINISKNGKHLFASHERSLQSEDEFLTVLAVLIKKFPDSEGYEITAYRTITSSKPLNLARIFKGKKGDK